MALSPGCADPTGPKALRASAGALFRVPVCGFDEAPGRRVALVAHGGTPLADVDLARPVVLVLGAEREGLPEDVLARCDVRASIPQTGDAESLNVAMAGTVALYELARRRPRKAAGPLSRAGPEIRRAGGAFVHLVRLAFRLGVAPSSYGPSVEVST